MSRIGKSPVEIPSGVEVSIVNDLLTAKGKNGALTVRLHKAVEVKQDDGKVVVEPGNDRLDQPLQPGEGGNALVL